MSENKKRDLLATNDQTGVSSNSAQEWSYCQLCSVYVKLHPFGPFRSSNRAFPCSSTLSKQFDGVEPLTQFNYQDLIDNFLILLLHICKSVTRIIMVLDQGYVFYLKCEFYHYMFAGYWMDIVGRSYMIITSGSWRVKYQRKRLISNKSPLSWSSKKNFMDIFMYKVVEIYNHMIVYNDNF